MHIHVPSLQESLKKRKLKDGQYNEQYKKGNQKTVVHRTMHTKKMQLQKHKPHWKPEMTVFVTFNSKLDIYQAQASDQFLAATKLSTNKAICLKTKNINKSEMYFRIFLATNNKYILWLWTFNTLNRHLGI
jgi:hypothetical protein